MKRVRYFLASFMIFMPVTPFVLSMTAYADTPPLIISEIKIRNDTDGFDEFIELYNASSEAISLNDYKIGYINLSTPADDQVFATSVIAGGILPAGESLVLAKNELDPNLPDSKKSPFSSLSDSGGTLRITDSEDLVIDQFSWTSTSSLAIEPIQLLCTASTTLCNANRLQSFIRQQDSEGAYVYPEATWQLDEPSPISTTLLPLPIPEPEPEPTPDPNPELPPDEEEVVIPDPPTEEPVTETSLQSLQITELLPNPAPPASDSSDEFIEIYNPNTQPVNLAGYKLQSGNTFSYSYIFANTTLGAGEYKAFYITQTGNILSNASGQARLLDSNGEVIAQTNVYDTANEGDAWAFINGAWQWTTTPTPHLENALVLPVLKVASTASTTKKSTTKKVAATKKASTSKVATAKTKKPAALAAERQIYEDPTETIAPINSGILVGVGLITLLYAIYEYRYDVVNRYQQLRRHREVRRATRP